MNDTADMAAPDVAGPVIAYRAWQVNGDSLTSMAVREHVWQPGKDHQATCPLSAPAFPNLHDAPSPGCRCGFYVMHTLDDLLNEPTQVAHVRAYLNPVVAGEVEVWGHSERYERGRRVQWCRIRSLYDTPLAGDVDIGALAELAELLRNAWQHVKDRAVKAAEAGQSLHDELHQGQTRDPDKPTPGQPKDHLRLAQQRTPRSMHPKGGWKP